MKQRILIVEDDEMVQALLAAFLENEGFTISSAITGREMFAILDKEAVHLILLDLNLPDEDGLALARQIRTRSTIPIIVLTARQGREDRLTALDLGADDYLTKPFDPKELVMRARNLLGRTQAQETHGVRVVPSDVVAFKGWTLDFSSRTLTAPEGHPVDLTPGEFNLLAALAKAPNRVLSRDTLLDAVSRHGETASDRVIDVFVSRLRKKIEADSKKPKLIITIPGYGYKFAGSPG